MSEKNQGMCGVRMQVRGKEGKYGETHKTISLG